MVDKNLFLHDLAVVAILKNEGAYLKEWLDYHLLAGVEHFYLYDNESPDNQAEVVKPYVEAGLVDYFSLPGDAMQFAAYNDAIKRFKFHCRYMAFIDGDEFIYPKVNWGGGISEVVDEILSKDPKAAGMSINWQCFGSNGQEKANYSRGVLERFTRRAPKDHGINYAIKTINNPRVIDLKEIHDARFFEDFYYCVNENGRIVRKYKNRPVTAEKIVVNHYCCKSFEEFLSKVVRGDAVFGRRRKVSRGAFELMDRNEEFDDGILAYRDARAKVYQPPKPRSNDVLMNALERNLSTDSYTGKMETFLTCLTLSHHLKEKSFEEAALKAITQTLSSELNLTEKMMFIRELPGMLELPYPIVKELRLAALKVVATLKEKFQSQIQDLSFRIINVALSNKLTLEDKNSFIKELSEILNLPSLPIKEMRLAELQFTQKLIAEFAPKKMWVEHAKAWEDYFEMNYIHELLELQYPVVKE